MHPPFYSGFRDSIVPQAEITLKKQLWKLLTLCKTFFPKSLLSFFQTNFRMAEYDEKNRTERNVTTMRILIVEDERRLAEALGQIMEEQRYQADLVYDGADGVDYALTGQYDAIILDVMLPKVDGFEVARRLRAAHVSTPILMLTARDEVPDKIAGLDHGADDYMTKPFDIGELLARVRALTRRQGEVVGEQLVAGDLTLDLSSRCLRRGEKSVRLGFKEFDVLRLLMIHPRSVVPKEDIISRVWGLESDAEDNNVEVYISFLRKKLLYLSSTVTIGTVRKVGYYLEAPEE